MPLDYVEFFRYMVAFRYQANAEARRNSSKALGAAVTKLLRVEEMAELETGDFPLQLDLVLNAAELASMPLETAVEKSLDHLEAVRVSWPPSPTVSRPSMRKL